MSATTRTRIADVVVIFSTAAAPVTIGGTKTGLTFFAAVTGAAGPLFLSKAREAKGQEEQDYGRERER